MPISSITKHVGTIFTGILNNRRLNFLGATCVHARKTKDSFTKKIVKASDIGNLITALDLFQALDYYRPCASDISEL